MKGLIIKQPWIDLILSGEKIWELRSRPTKIRGRIALIQQGTGLIVGDAVLTDSIGPLSDKRMEDYCYLHKVKPEQRGKWAHAWVLKDAKRYDKPIPYNHPQGAVIWVNLDF